MRLMKIDEIPFPIEVLLGRSELPFAAYQGLQIGDVIILDQNTEEGLVVRVGSNAYFRATAGLFETHKAVTIDGRIYA